LEFIGPQGQALVAFPKNGPLAGVIYENKSLLAGTPGCNEEMRFDTEACKFRAVEFGSAVVADLPDVTRAQSPLLASHHGGGDLASGQNLRGAKFDFGPAFGIVCDGNQGVGGV
jgi:hypothetical protein